MNKNIDKCPFCTPESTVIVETGLVYSIFDNYPVSKGHALIIPKRHVGNYFDLTIKEQDECQVNLKKLKKVIDKEFHPDGYNIGVNIGKTAGQTISHVHIHLIPRYVNDVEDPTGGVRNVIPEKGNYVMNKGLWNK